MAKKKTSVFNRLLAALLVVPLVFVIAAGCSFTQYEVKNSYVFGGIMPFVFWGYGKNTDKAFEEMQQLFEKIDRLTNINRKGDSDVLSINLASADMAVEIDPMTYDIIVLAKQYYSETEGAFNVASYPLSYLWGIDAVGFGDFQYDREYENIEDWIIPQSFKASTIKRRLPLPDYSEVLRVKEFCDLDKLTVYQSGEKYYAEKQLSELMIDLGGISKGYAIDQCAKICQSYGIESAKIDLSGHLFFIGKYQNKSDWNVGIGFDTGRATLDESDDYFCAFSIGGEMSAVTSGDYQRFRTVKIDNQTLRIPHTLNSKTGLPYTLTFASGGGGAGGYQNIEGSVTSCTVVARGGAFADAYATAASIYGIERARDFFVDKGIKAIMFTSDSRSAFTCGISPILTDTYQVYKDFTRLTD